MKSERGSALAFVLIIFSVLMVLGTIVLKVSLAETRFVMHDVETMKVEYTARSGAEAMASYLIENPEKIMETIHDTSGVPATGSLNGYAMEITVSGTAENFKISSSAVRDGQVVSSIFLDMLGEKADLLKFSVFSNETPSTGKNHKGNVGTNANSFNIFGSNKIEGNAQVVGATNVEALEDKVTGTVTSVTHEVVIPPINTALFVDSLPNTESHHIGVGETAYYKSTYIGRNSNGGTFTASGGGSLHILLDQLGKNIDVVVENDTKVVLYTEASVIALKGNPQLPVVLYAPNADITFSGGGNGGVTGQIICNSYVGPTSNAFDFQEVDFNIDDIAVGNAVSHVKRVKYNNK